MKSTLKWRRCIAVLLLLSMSDLTIATDFQMPENVASASDSGGQSKKSLVSKGSYKLLTKVQDAIDQTQYDEAFERLNKLIFRVKDNAYESAVVLKTAGYIYVSLQEISKALPLLDKALKLNSLARENQQKLRYDIAQLLMSQQNVKHLHVDQQDINEAELNRAITYLTSWLGHATEEELSAAIYARIGTAFLQLKKYSQASTFLTKAIKWSNSQDKKPSEYHHQLLLASYLEQQNYEAAIDVLKRLTVHFGKNKNYRMQLVGLYDETGQAKQALAVLEVAFKQGLLDDTAEYTALAQRLMQAGYPHKATNILQHGLDSFIVWVTPENLTLLASAYIQAQEPQNAIPILKKAMFTASNALPGQLLSQLFIEKEQWSSAIDTLLLTLDKAKEDDAIGLQLSLGYAYYEHGQIDEAKALFNQLIANTELDKKTKRTVQDWQRYLRNI